LSPSAPEGEAQPGLTHPAGDGQRREPSSPPSTLDPCLKPARGFNFQPATCNLQLSTCILPPPNPCPRPAPVGSVIRPLPQAARTCCHRRQTPNPRPTCPHPTASDASWSRPPHCLPLPQREKPSPALPIPLATDKDANRAVLRQPLTHIPNLRGDSTFNLQPSTFNLHPASCHPPRPHSTPSPSISPRAFISWGSRLW